MRNAVIIKIAATIFHVRGVTVRKKIPLVRKSLKSVEERGKETAVKDVPAKEQEPGRGARVSFLYPS